MILAGKYTEAVPENITMLCYQYMSCKRHCWNSLSIRASRISIQCNLERHRNSLYQDKNRQAAVLRNFVILNLCRLSKTSNLCKLGTIMSSSNTEHVFHHQMLREDMSINLINSELVKIFYKCRSLRHRNTLGTCCNRDSCS